MAKRLSLMLLAAAALVTATPDWTDCPSACRCKWTSGKKTALCRDAGLGALPGSLSSDMQVLDLSGNSIPLLPGEAFRSVGLINLQRIFLRNARIRRIHRDAFRELIILIEVDLSENEISALDPQTFRGNDRLRMLLLGGNPLESLLGEQFPPLPHLRTLELPRCRLSRVHRDAFIHLAALEALDLRHNKLRQLSEAVFMSTGRLNTLALDGNPWRCDCQLRGFRNWFLSSNLRSVPLQCSEPPELAKRPWHEIPSGDFACAPTLQITAPVVRSETGGNASFGCNVRGDPEPEVTWLYNGRPIGSPNSSVSEQLVIESEEGLLEKWTNVSVVNVSEADAGEYSCVAKNSQGAVSRNVTLVLWPEVATATTLGGGGRELAWLGVACGGAAALLTALGAVTAACCVWSRGRRRRKRHRRKSHLKGSVSFSDQEKKLLDVSITTAERAPSCELLQAEMELLEQQQQQQRHSPVELCADPPVHITIESGAMTDQQVMFPPPPPEFSTSVLPAGAFGNIFISVSVSQDPSVEVTRYPDLLDIARGTLPRNRQREPPPLPPPPQQYDPQYDNMGPRVTAGGSSTLSLPDAVAPLEDIPPPPPPPSCTPHGEYVSL